MHRLWPLALLLGLPACLFARADARIRRGSQFAVTSAALSTRDARTRNPDSILTGYPSTNDAANVRGVTEVSIAYGWERAELRWHVPLFGWASGEDFPFPSSRIVPPDETILGSLELYVQALRLGRVSAGLGVETTRAAYAVATVEVSAADAISATVRGLYIGKEGQGRSALLQGQVSYTHALDAKHDLGVFAGWATSVGSGDPLTVRVHGGDWIDSGRSHVEASTFGFLGARIDWH